jgi:hypothetical protein
MRIPCLCLLALGCALRPNDPAPAPAGGRPAAASARDSADAGDETAGCATDADCALTRVPPGGCCPMLCTPRAVTRQRADALEAAIPACHKGRECPEPLCRPPRDEIAAACAQGRCVARSEGPAR